MRFSDTIHVLTYIEIYHGISSLTSQAIATSIETNPANVRKIMVDLKRANLIKTVVGKAQPTLAKLPEEITLLDIFNCLDEDTQLIQVDPKTNPDCIIGGNIQTVLNKKYQEFQDIVLAEMKKTTLADILHEVAQAELHKRPENRDIISRFL